MQNVERFSNCHLGKTYSPSPSSVKVNIVSMEHQDQSRKDKISSGQRPEYGQNKFMERLNVKFNDRANQLIKEKIK